MGLSQALFSAISGLTNHQRAMDNIGNNLANVNTVAFKKGVFQFRTLLEQTLRGGTAADGTTERGPINPISMGLGTQTGSINKVFTQGSLEVTGNLRDMAIEGNGYYVMRQGNNYVYTRDGTFYLGSEGELLGGNGLQVQGVMAENGSIPEAGDLADLMIPIGETGAAVETTKVSFTGNLDSDQEVSTGLKLASDPANILGNEIEYFGDVANAAAGVGVDDATWDGLTAGSDTMINGGTVTTTVAMAQWDAGTGTFIEPANVWNVPMEDFGFLRGSSWIRPFQGIDVATTPKDVSISFRKGGRQELSTFTYGTNSNTMGDLMTFLTGGTDDVASIANILNIESLGNQRIVGGAMGTIKIAGNVSGSLGGTAAYNSPVETAGAFGRTDVANQVTYDAGGGVTGDAHYISVVSNLGEENAITDITLSYDNVNYSDVFGPDNNYSATQGGSSATNIVVYDSLGNPKNATLQMVLVERDSNFSTWRWYADSEDDTDSDWNVNTAGAIDTDVNVGTGLIRFDSEGNFVGGTELSETGGIEISLANQGVNDRMVISLQEGLSGDVAQNLDFSDMTQVSSPSDFNLEAQDGSAPGTLDTFTVTTDGVIQGVFSNGQVSELGRMSLALIPNEAGLVPLGSNNFTEGPASGAAQINFAGVGGRGFIRSGQLESSNVDLSEEFTKLITTERGFQANARVITTSDEMLVELVNMKR